MRKTFHLSKGPVTVESGALLALYIPENAQCSIQFMKGVQATKEGVNLMFHELLHHSCDKLSEKEVDRIATDMTEVFWDVYRVQIREKWKK